MSIRVEIAARVAEARLIQLTPMMPGPTETRRLYLAASVAGKIDGPWATARDGRLAGAARALMESFVRGDLVVARMPPSKNVETVIALLEPPTNNVWAFRVRVPKPGARILGRFAEPDTFIATHWVNREDFIDAQSNMSNPRKWRDESVRCKAIWTHLFPSYDPITGSTIHDFISNSRLPV
jgi:hypothetical protein